jgi:cytochrome c-type biogenesis protein CcmH
MTTRREFFVGATGAVAAAAALIAREARAQQQPTNFVPMNEGAYRPVLKEPKPNATPSMTDLERDAFEKTLKCQCSCILDVYTCRTTDFTCGVSPAMHRDVNRLIAGGYSAAEIRAAFVEVYGEVALTEPVKQGFNWLGYLAPSIVLATGAIVLTFVLRRWSVQAAVNAAARTGNAASGSSAPSASDDEMARLERAVREDR